MAESEDIAMPRPIVPDEEIPEIAERIMLAAIHLFGRKGYSATSVREIVQEADVTNPMLYYYFDSKEGLFERLMEFLFQYMQNRIAETVGDDELDLLERIRMIAGSHLEGVRESPEVLRFVYSVIFGPAESRPPIDVHAMHRKTHDMVAGMFQTAVESGEFEPANNLTADQLAELLLGLINQELMRILNLHDHAPSADEAAALLNDLTGSIAVDRITAFFLGGVGTIQKDSKS